MTASRLTSSPPSRRRPRTKPHRRRWRRRRPDVPGPYKGKAETWWPYSRRQTNGPPSPNLLPSRPLKADGARIRLMNDMSRSDAPKLSVGLAVRNEAGRAIRRCVESVLAQDFTDLELV